MPASTEPLRFARAIVAASGTSVVAVASDGVTPLPPPWNCHTVIVYNPDSTIIGMVGLGTAPAALTGGTNAMSIAPGGSLTLALGTFARRGFMDAAVLVGSGLIYDSFGGAVTLQIGYLCLLGGAG